MEVYEAGEDSFLLRNCLPTDLRGKKVLEIGSGSGILSVEAARRGGSVVAVDINPRAVACTRQAALDAHVTVVACEGDLFEPVLGEEFDLILCNPPYLPTDAKDPDIALDGGPEGWEFIDRFLSEAALYLAPKGRILLLFSSHSQPDKIAELFATYNLTSQLLGRKEVGFFEELFVVELQYHGSIT
jgi:release factor glutamine methyltransferase